MIWRLISSVLRKLRWLFWQTIYRGYRSQYTVHATFRFNGAAIQLYGDGSIELGSHSYIGELSTIQAVKGCSVTIGDHCSISHNVRIYTSTTLPDLDPRAQPLETSEGSVSIGGGVWIGANSYIAPGITVGENSVVGANSVVTRSIPSGEIWGGVPARLIRPKTSVQPTSSLLSSR